MKVYVVEEIEWQPETVVVYVASTEEKAKDWIGDSDIAYDVTEWEVDRAGATT